MSIKIYMWISVSHYAPQMLLWIISGQLLVSRWSRTVCTRLSKPFTPSSYSSCNLQHTGLLFLLLNVLIDLL